MHRTIPPCNTPSHNLPSMSYAPSTFVGLTSLENDGLCCLPICPCSCRSAVGTDCLALAITCACEDGWLIDVEWLLVIICCAVGLTPWLCERLDTVALPSVSANLSVAVMVIPCGWFVLVTICPCGRMACLTSSRVMTSPSGCRLSCCGSGRRVWLAIMVGFFCKTMPFAVL